MSVKKIQFDGHTLIDLTQDTVVASKLHSGYTAHDANGDIITGNYDPPSGSMNITANGTYDVTNKESAVVAVATGSQNSRVWTFTLSSNSSSGETILIANSDAWLDAHKNDSTLVMTITPLFSVTPAAYMILCCTHTAFSVDSSTSRYGRSVRFGAGTSLADNNYGIAVGTGGSTPMGFIIESGGKLSFRARDNGGNTILQAGTWLVTAAVKPTS